MSREVPNLIERRSDPFYLMKNLECLDPKYVYELRKATVEGKQCSAVPQNMLVR